jgi:hypothetical protein
VAVVDQVRAVLRQPEVVLGTWRTARDALPDLTEAEVREALERLNSLWEELFPAGQAPIIALLLDRVHIGPDGVDVQLRLDGLASLVRDLGAGQGAQAKVAA